MGWKLNGIILDKNFEKDFHALLNSLELPDYQLEKETTFEQETTEMLEDGYISIGFFGKGTYLSTGTGLMTDNQLLIRVSTGLNVLAFYVNDTTSTYCFDFYSKGEHLRSKWLSYSDENIDSSTNFGALLPIEQDNANDLDTILKLIGSTLSQDFFAIEESEPMFRFTNTKPVSNNNTKSNPKGFWKRFFS